MKKLAVIACISALGTTAQADSAVTACLTPARDIAQVTDALEASGWALQNLKTLDAHTIDHLAWMRVVTFLESGDGGETVQTIFELQRKAVLGYARKIDLATSKTRVLSNDGNTAFISWRISPMGPYELDCAFTGSTTEQSDNIRITELDEADLTITETALGYSEGDL
jgi:hypothetical protein